MDLPERPAGKPPQGSWVSLAIAAMAALMILTALVMLTGGYLGLVILVGGGVFAMAGFHYLVWGWWLSDSIRREQAEADEREARDARQREDLSG